MARYDSYDKKRQYNFSTMLADWLVYCQQTKQLTAYDIEHNQALVNECIIRRLQYWPRIEGPGQLETFVYNKVLLGVGIKPLQRMMPMRQHILLGRWESKTWAIIPSFIQPALATSVIEIKGLGADLCTSVLQETVIISKSSTGKMGMSISNVQGGCKLAGTRAAMVTDMIMSRLPYPISADIIHVNLSYSRLVFHLRVGYRTMICTLSEESISVLSLVQLKDCLRLPRSGGMYIYNVNPAKKGTHILLDKYGSICTVGDLCDVEGCYSKLKALISEVLSNGRYRTRFIQSLRIIDRLSVS